METNTPNQCDTETDDVHSVLYLTVDVGASVQQHLDHGLVPAHAGIHERGHPLRKEQAEEELQAAVSLVYLLKSKEGNSAGMDGKTFLFEPEAFPPT